MPGASVFFFFMQRLNLGPAFIGPLFPISRTVCQIAKAMNFLLTKQEFLTIIIGLTGCGEVWYRAWFGTKRPRVRIPTLRPNPAEIFRFQPDFSAYSELFPMENSVTFPSDPNPTQTGIRSGKCRKISFAACRSISSGRRARFCSFLVVIRRLP